MNLRYHLTALLLLLPIGFCQAQDAAPASESRTALIIGVGDYSGTRFAKLPGIDKDLARMKAALEKTGFSVTALEDPNLTAAEKAVDEFGATLRAKKGVGLFYFSGHGGELEGQNFLIPKGARIGEPADIKLQALAAQRVLSRMETSGARVSLLFLDACRNDMTKAATETGLAAMNVKGTFIGFATATDKLSNASTEGSPYTTVLAEMIQKPGLSVSDMHTLVNARVQEVTKDAPGGQQVPFQYSGLNSLFYFQPGVVKDDAAEVAALRKQLEAMKRAGGAPAAPAEGGANPASGTPAAATKESPFTNSLGMKLVPVAGTSVLFCIHETRSKDFAAFIADKNRGYNMIGEGATDWRSYKFKGVPVGRNASEPADKSNHPVTNVSWFDAVAFCEWLQRKEGIHYRLPTDPEWSLAVGVRVEEKGTPESLSLKVADLYPWPGGRFAVPTISGNYADWTFGMQFENFNIIKNYNDHFPTTAPVMNYAANELGIYDLGGNVWEWLAGCYDGKDPIGRDSTISSNRVIRGACWNNNSTDDLRSSFRGNHAPTTRYSDIGFRVVITL